MRVLVVNAGSTSVKLRCVDGDDRISAAEDLGPAGDDLSARLERFLARAGPVEAVGHRVVHGGPHFTEPVVINDSVRAELEALNDLAPLHNPPAVGAVDALRRLRPAIPAVACFDTAFHRTLAPDAATYALPEEWVTRWGIRRYGFHGLSCEWAAGRAPAMVGRPARDLRLVICHLGGGASVTAVYDGRSVDTTMGFTPTEGLVMATRPGDVDPGGLTWLIRHGVGPDELDEALERRSGLLALSGGRSGDMRNLLEERDSHGGTARLAIDVYLHRLRAKIAAMAAASGGLDALVFTGGVGEHSAVVRAETCAPLGWMGVALDPGANAAVDAADSHIGAPGSPVATLVIHSREELIIAAACRDLLSTTTN
jgi:acetate kinase